jgi:hypothetical protein
MDAPRPSPELPMSGWHSEPSYVAWVRARQQQARRRAALLSTLVAHADPSEAADNHGQAMAWAEQHAQAKRLHDSAMAQLRHG